MTTLNNDELREGYVKVILDYAPIDDEDKFKEWCKKYNFDYVGLEGRGAWCSALGTYFRGASGVAFNDGEMFLFYDDDVVDVDKLIATHDQQLLEAILEGAEPNPTTQAGENEFVPVEHIKSVFEGRK